MRSVMYVSYTDSSEYPKYIAIATPIYNSTESTDKDKEWVNTQDNVCKYPTGFIYIPKWAGQWHVISLVMKPCIAVDRVPSCNSHIF